MQSVQLSPDWRFVSDRVMGGVSDGGLQYETVDGRYAARMTGRVSLENNGGFVQIAFDLSGAAPDLKPADWAGIAFDHFGNDETYEVRLRTAQLTLPWQSFRAEVNARPSWTTSHIPFADFAAHRTQEVFYPAALRRVGVLAIGRAFDADLSISRVAFYR